MDLGARAKSRSRQGEQGEPGGRSPGSEDPKPHALVYNHKGLGLKKGGECHESKSHH